MLVLFASELAACIGCHKYQSVSAAKLQVWSRTDPKSFAIAQERCNQAVATSHAQRVEQITNVTSISSALEAAVHSTEPAQVHREIARALATPLTDTTEATMTKARSVADDPEALKKLCTPSDKLLLTDSATVRLESAIAATQVPGNKAKQDELIKKALETVKVGDCKTAKQDVESAVFTKRGQLQESAATTQYEEVKNSTVSRRNDKLYKKMIQDGERKVLLVGKIDGINSEGKLVEVKSRQRRIFNWLPLYEKVQVFAYMFLTDIHECDLVQKYGSDTKVESYEFSEKVWQEYSQGALKFSDDMVDLLQNTKIQDELIRSS